MLRADRHGHQGNLGGENCCQDFACETASERQGKFFVFCLNLYLFQCHTDICFLNVYTCSISQEYNNYGRVWGELALLKRQTAKWNSIASHRFEKKKPS